MSSSSSTPLPSKLVVETYRRQEKRARIADPPRAHCGSPDAADANWRDWANLIAGPAGLIAERVLADDVADYLRFRAVCGPWRRCAASPHAHGGLDRRFHPRRWIMLPPTLGALRKRREFMNVSTGERIQVDLPELRYQYVFGPTSGGLIVLCDRRTYDVHLLNPLTRQLTGLPNATTLLHGSQERVGGYTIKFLQVCGAGLADDSTVALCFRRYWLVTAKPGDKHWTRLNLCYHKNNGVLAALSFASRFYCVTENNAIMVVDTSAYPPQLVTAAELGDCDIKEYDWTVRLVDNDDGELILVHRIPHDNHNTSREGHEVRRVDLEARITLPMEELGGRALFVGDGYHAQAPAISLPARLSPHVRADTIYSCKDYGCHYSLRYYNNLYDRPIIDVYRLPYGRVPGGIGDARSCSVIEYRAVPRKSEALCETMNYVLDVTIDEKKDVYLLDGYVSLRFKSSIPFVPKYNSHWHQINTSQH
uniref:Uncharacterized protein n=1 Tax=Avena sativa TaxID=4498 RepID=A0ACD5ULD5_AVESA